MLDGVGPCFAPIPGKTDIAHSIILAIESDVAGQAACAAFYAKVIFASRPW